MYLQGAKDSILIILVLQGPIDAVGKVESTQLTLDAGIGTQVCMQCSSLYVYSYVPRVVETAKLELPS